MEFEINLSEMPLGKLSKSNIQKGASIKLYYTLHYNTSCEYFVGRLYSLYIQLETEY